MATKMKKNYIYTTSGTCSSAILLTVEEDILVSARYLGGCSGNTQGVAKLVEGMKLSEVESKLAGIQCGGRPTSCPDQLANAIRMIRNGETGSRLKEV